MFMLFQQYVSAVVAADDLLLPVVKGVVEQDFDI
jgi:hypothetical protein